MSERAGDRQSGQLLRLATEQGPVRCYFSPAPGARAAALFVGGAGGGWDTPAGDLYPRLVQQLAQQGVAALRVRYRQPGKLREAVYGILAGLDYLETHTGIERVALVGYSFGGAAAIQAAVLAPVVRAVVTLATQSQGVELVGRLAGRCSLLLVHGTADLDLPAGCSQYTYELAGEPKELMLYAGAGHALSEVSAELRGMLQRWIVKTCASAGH